MLGGSSLVVISIVVAVDLLKLLGLLSSLVVVIGRCGRVNWLGLVL